jgi:acyl dehydratase
MNHNCHAPLQPHELLVYICEINFRIYLSTRLETALPIDRDTLLNWSIPETRHTYTKRDTMLYSLGIGLGTQPTDRNELRFVYENGLEALPSMSLVLGYPGFWFSDPRTGVNWKALLHGEQGFENFRPLPVAGTVIGRTRVTEVIDKGADKGALVFTEREVVDAATGELLSRLTSTSVLRADGGFGGPSGPVPPPHVLPDRLADEVCDLATLPQAALIYRLSGDYNPLHADPKVAETARFARPILHGMCTFGIACHALLRAACGYQPERLRSMRCRFTSPVFPGETIRVEVWKDGDEISFRASVPERQVVALNNGHARLNSS